MQLGFKIPPHHVEWSTMLDAFRACDDGGVYAQGWNFDHFRPIEEPIDGPCLEGWTTLTALAQATSRIRVGCLVTGVHHRHPVVLANMASAVDIISGGRLELGLGAGWQEGEDEAYGFGLGSLKERFDRFDEALEVITGLLTTDVVDFSGHYYRLRGARNEPKGPQQPLPICIGGVGKRRVLGAVARWAHHWNLPAFDRDWYTELSAVLAERCAEVGRDPAEIRRSCHVYAAPGEAPDVVVARVVDVADTGLDQAIVYPQPPVERSVIDLLDAVGTGVAEALGDRLERI